MNLVAKEITKILNGERQRDAKIIQKKIARLSFPQFLHKFRQSISYSGGYSYLKYPAKILLAGHSACFRKGSQVGVTELVLSLVFFWLFCRGVNIFYMLPTDGEISDFCAARFDTVVEGSDILSEILAFDNVHHKRVGNANLYLRGGQAPGGKPSSKIKSVPVSKMIRDEYDEIAEVVLDIVEERLSGSFEKQIIDLSTPKIATKGISLLYTDDSKQHEYRVACVHCGYSQPLSLASLDLQNATYLCCVCKKAWTHEQKVQMVADAAETGWTLLAGADKYRYGFDISQLYSPTVTAAEVTEKYHKADNELKKQTFYNHKLGLPYTAEGARLSESLVDERIGNYSMPCSRVAGIDVSSASPHYVVIADWSEPGPVVVAIERVTWEDLKSVLDKWFVKSVVIDIAPERSAARKFIGSLRGTRGWMALYPNGMKDMVTPDENSGQVKISRTEAIDVVLDRFRKDQILISEQAAGSQQYLHFRDHVCNVIRGYRETRSGYEAFYTENGPDHYLHALVYAEAAGKLLPFAPAQTGADVIGRFV